MSKRKSVRPGWAALGTIAVTMCLSRCAMLNAANYSWQVASGDWSVGSNWGSAVPTWSDAAYVVDGGTAAISAAGAACQSLYLGDLGSSNSGTIQMSDGMLLPQKSEYVGNQGAGVFNQSGGTNGLAWGSGSLRIANNAGGSGTYNLSGTGLLSAASEYVGYSGIGVLSQSGGTNTLTNLGSLNIGWYSGSVGTYNLSGCGVLSAYTENVGSGGLGTFNQSAGTNTVGQSLYVGNTSSGLYSLSGSGLLSAGNEYVGIYGSGTIAQTGGTNNVAGGGGTLYLGNQSVSGYYVLSGSGVLSANIEYVAYYGNGTLSQSGGVNTALELILGQEMGYTSAYNLSGGSLTTSTQIIGQSSNGNPVNAAFNQSGGTNSGTYLRLGDNRGASGTYNLSGSGLLSVSEEDIAGNGSGSFYHSGGTNNVNILNIGATGSTFAGTYQLSGSGVLSAGTENIGTSGNGTFTQSGGTNIVVSLNLDGGYNLNGGLLQVSGFQSFGRIGLNGGTLQASANNTDFLFVVTASVQAGGAIIDVQGFDITLGQPLLHSSYLGSTADGGLTKAGTGTLTLIGTNTLTGNTYVAAGTLVLGNSLALPNSTLDTSGSGSLGFGALNAATLGGLQGSGNLLLGNSASAAIALSVGGNNTSTTFSGGLSGPGSLTKIGRGVLLLTGSNTYAGPTTISRGELLVDGSLFSPATVNSGGTLGGTGSLTSVTVNPGGHLAPGDSPGKLVLSGSLGLVFGAKLDFQLDTPLDSDEVFMPTGLLALNGQQFADFNFTPLANFAPGIYTLVDAGAISGSLGASTSGAIDGYSAYIARSGNDLVLTVVPEPSTAALVLAAAIGLLGCARRRQISKLFAFPAGLC